MICTTETALRLKREGPIFSPSPNQKPGRRAHVDEGGLYQSERIFHKRKEVNNGRMSFKR